MKKSICIYMISILAVWIAIALSCFGCDVSGAKKDNNKTLLQLFLSSGASGGNGYMSVAFDGQSYSMHRCGAAVESYGLTEVRCAPSEQNTYPEVLIDVTTTTAGIYQFLDDVNPPSVVSFSDHSYTYTSCIAPVPGCTGGSVNLIEIGAEGQSITGSFSGKLLGNGEVKQIDGSFNVKRGSAF